MLEDHGLAQELFEQVNEYLKGQGMAVNRGTIVDAKIIHVHAPSSTKNRQKERDPEMRQTRKVNQWYFGMKAHIGVDSRSKLIHSVEATAANVHDSRILETLLHGKERRVWGDSAYAGQKEAMTKAAPEARDWTPRRGHRYRKLTEQDRAQNRCKSRVQAKVKHQFGILKLRFGFIKMRYRGLAKKAYLLVTACALSNLVMAKKGLVASMQCDPEAGYA